MTVEQLRDRMAEWLTSQLWTIDCIVDERTIGYAVWQLRQDEYQAGRSIAHIRQLFVERERRNAGVGSAAIRALVEQRFPTSELLIEVLTSNPKARRFWAKAGFSEYATTMLMPRA